MFPNIFNLESVTGCLTFGWKADMEVQTRPFQIEVLRKRLPTSAVILQRIHVGHIYSPSTIKQSNHEAFKGHPRNREPRPRNVADNPSEHAARSWAADTSSTDGNAPMCSKRGRRLSGAVYSERHLPSTRSLAKRHICRQSRVREREKNTL